LKGSLYVIITGCFEQRLILKTAAGDGMWRGTGWTMFRGSNCR